MWVAPVSFLFRVFLDLTCRFLLPVNYEGQKACFWEKQRMAQTGAPVLIMCPPRYDCLRLSGENMHLVCSLMGSRRPSQTL